MLRQRSQNDKSVKPDMRIKERNGGSLHPDLLPSGICRTLKMNNFLWPERTVQTACAVQAQKNNRAPANKGHEHRHNLRQKIHAVNTSANQNDVGKNADNDDAKNTMAAYALPKNEKVLRSESYNLPSLRGQAKKEGGGCHVSILQTGQRAERGLDNVLKR